VDLADALREAESLERAETVYREAIELAATRGDERYGAHATLGLLDTLWFIDPGALGDGGRQEAERIIGVLERFGDDLGIAKALRMLAHAYFSMGQSVKAQKAVEQAIDAAKRAGDERWEARIVRLYCLILFWGPTPLNQVVDYTNQALQWARRVGVRALEASALSVLARAAAMQGRIAEARPRRRFAGALSGPSRLAGRGRWPISR
jgi:tetratricopeptide (TPR) repeat protein